MLLGFLFFLLAGAVIAAIFSLNALINTLKFGLPFVTTPNWAIEWLSNNLHLSSSDIVYELGCGDARVMGALAKKFPAAKFIGIEIQWWPYILAKWRTRRIPNVTIVHGDFLRTDLSAATLIYGFFITVMMPKVGDKLRQSLHAGVPVISFGFALPGWSASNEINNPDKPSGSKIRIYSS